MKTKHRITVDLEDGQLDDLLCLLDTLDVPSIEVEVVEDLYDKLGSFEQDGLRGQDIPQRFSRQPPDEDFHLDM